MQYGMVACARRGFYPCRMSNVLQFPMRFRALAQQANEQTALVIVEATPQRQKLDFSTALHDLCVQWLGASGRNFIGNPKN